MCGELSRAQAAVFGIIGSSPRVRGTRAFPRLNLAVHRFIPACAGNSSTGRPPPARSPVHPRVCGELIRRFHAVPAAHRFIPACAGNSATSAPSGAAPPVHPRVCGELTPRKAPISRCDGSSPRVRGTPASSARRQRVLRFIPACAGNSAMSRTARSASPVHPRVCGELELLAEGGLLQGGSSPRVRGTPRFFILPGLRLRFIPACAGNSPSRSTPWRRRSVHPRVCGELRPGSTTS